MSLKRIQKVRLHFQVQIAKTDFFVLPVSNLMFGWKGTVSRKSWKIAFELNETFFPTGLTHWLLFRNTTTWRKTHLSLAPLDQSTPPISITGRLLSVDQKTPHTRVDFSSWIFTSQWTTHSSHQRCPSPLESTIQTLIHMELSVWISSRTNGVQHSQSPRVSPSKI